MSAPTPSHSTSPTSTQSSSTSAKQPNIVLIVSDEERRNGWLADQTSLPAHDRLRADGLSFDRHYTHSSPCSPSRASLWTGRYLPQHGVVDNVSFPAHTALDPAIPTVGSLLRDQGYESAYLGKWHLSQGEHPDLEAHGYSGWSGNDKHFTGGAWTQHRFDPDIAEQAVDWLGARPADQPWFLTISFLGPHDIMWYPIDQPDYRAAHPDEAETLFAIQDYWLGMRMNPAELNYPERFDRLPENFGDDLHTKPEIQRAWRHVRNTEHFVGAMDLADTRSWLRQLDYYAWLHEVVDTHVGTVLSGLDDLGLYDDTMIIYTSDHGDACGSHGLRAKLPCMYEEVMGVPLIIKEPRRATTDGAGVAEPTTSVAGRRTEALSTHVDLATTIAAAGGVDVNAETSLRGKDLAPVLAAPDASVRDHVIFAQDSAQSDLLRNTRYAMRGFFDGTTKYAHYYGVGGGIRRNGDADEVGKVFDVDAAFDDLDHEYYDTAEDPLELSNLAQLRGRRGEVRELHDRLRAIEADELGAIT